MISAARKRAILVPRIRLCFVQGLPAATTPFEGWATFFGVFKWVLYEKVQTGFYFVIVFIKVNTLNLYFELQTLRFKV